MILVTGGAGYIGSHFVRLFRRRMPDRSLIVVDNLSEGRRDGLGDSPEIIFVEADVGDQRAMRSVFDRFSISAVVHFAGSCYVAESQTHPVKYFRNNVVNSQRLFEVMEQFGVRRIVFSSSCATYGAPVAVPISENHVQEPVNVYGITKLLVEQCLHNYAANLGWTAMSLRYFNAAGADESGEIGECHDPEPHLIPNILKAALGGTDHVNIWGADYDTPDGTCVRDYIHVNDLAEAHLQALEWVNEHQGMDAVNLGSARGQSVLDVIKTCENVTGRSIKVKIGPRREGDPPLLVSDNVKARTLLGWQHRYDLGDIIKTAWLWQSSRSRRHPAHLRYGLRKDH